MPKRSRASQRQTTTSNTYRFFVETGTIHGRDVLIEDGELSHQILTVLRLRAGEHVVMLDNCGWQYVVALAEIERGRVTGRIERKELAGGEPRTKITLYAALMRPERFEWILQKGTELGVSAFVPLICERSTIADHDALSDGGTLPGSLRSGCTTRHSPTAMGRLGCPFSPQDTPRAGYSRRPAGNEDRGSRIED